MRAIFIRLRVHLRTDVYIVVVNASINIFVFLKIPLGFCVCFLVFVYFAFNRATSFECLFFVLFLVSVSYFLSFVTLIYYRNITTGQLSNNLII